jgi:hypothetical protein
MYTDPIDVGHTVSLGGLHHTGAPSQTCIRQYFAPELGGNATDLFLCAHQRVSCFSLRAVSASSEH